MRGIFIIVAAALLSACGSAGEDDTATATASPGEGLGPGLYRFAEKSGLCSASDNSAAFVIYGEKDANCMAQGRIETADNGDMAFVPRGDDHCRIPIEDRGQSIILGDGGKACAYYCGGEARYAGRELIKKWGEEPDLRDAAGDSIC